MAMDAGTIYLSAPANGQATDAALGGALTAGDKAFFIAPQGMTIAEVGAIIGTATTVTPLAFTVAVAPKIGGAYAVKATVTAPGNLASGAVLKKGGLNIPLARGNVLRISVTGAPTAGTGFVYAIGYPGGPASAGETASTT